MHMTYVAVRCSYTAQLFYNQAQLKPGTVDAIRKAVPGLTDQHISIMQRCPMRSFDPQLIQVPHAAEQLLCPLSLLA